MSKPYKLGLSQIMKNEAHVAERMLNSIVTIIDAVFLVDTGSTDNTIEICKQWGIKNNIPVFVKEKAFDNFESCRNEAMTFAKDQCEYCFWLDFDEQIIIDPSFDKNKLDKDLYMFNTYIGSMKYTRNELWKCDKAFRWYGPCHEFIVCDDKNITSGLLEGIKVDVKMDGGSWKENVPAKYKSHAHVLEKYIDNNRQDPRWIFYTAQSYHDSACVPENKEENDERLRRSMKYYKERVARPDGYPEEIFYAQYRIGTIMRSMEEPWNLALNELLKAYNFDPLRGEPIKAIIDYYLAVGEYHNAYLFSSFGKKNYHGKNPFPQRLLFVDETLYVWKFLESHAAACFYTNRKDEAKQTFQEMFKISKDQPQFFTPEDMQKLQMNSQFFG